MSHHRPGSRLPASLVLAILLGACADRPAPTGPGIGPAPQRPTLTISDAATGGRAGFYLLPPLVSDPGPFTGTFDADLTNLTVKICQLSGSTCGSYVKTFSDGAASEAITADLEGQAYVAVWTSATLSVGSPSYRMEVRSGSILLGYADLLVVARQRDLKDLPAGYVGVVAGAPLSIKFRVEEGTVGMVAVTPSSATIPVGGTQGYTATVTDLYGAPMIGRSVAFASSDASVATVSPSGATTNVSGQAGTTATGAAAGGATILASTGGVSGSASITVTAVVADVAPTVVSKTPAAFATNVSRFTGITVTFSEPVNVSSNWIVLNCAGVQRTPGSGLQVTGGPTTFTIQPTTMLAANTLCTATIIAAFVSDQDANDPPDIMTAPVVWSFTTGS